MNYTAAFKRPFSDIKKLIIGFVITYIPIICFISKGYFLECAASAMQGQRALPNWRNFGKLFLRGIIATIIQAVYFIPAILIIFRLTQLINQMIASKETLLTELSVSAEPYLTTIVEMRNLLLLLLIVAIIIWYINPAAILQYVAYNRFVQGFNVLAIIKKAFTKEYFFVWVVSVGYAIVAFTVLFSVMMLIPLLAVPIAFLFYLAYFVTGVTMYSLLGSVYADLYAKQNEQLSEDTSTAI